MQCGKADGFTIDAGLTAFKKRRFAQAETAFRKAMEADPQSAAAHAYRAPEPKPHHMHRHAVRRAYVAPRHVWRSCRG